MYTSFLLGLNEIFEPNQISIIVDDAIPQNHLLHQMKDRLEQQLSDKYIEVYRLSIDNYHTLPHKIMMEIYSISFQLVLIFAAFRTN